MTHLRQANLSLLRNSTVGEDMRLYYLDESEEPTHYVRSATGINDEVWSKAFLPIQQWRKELMGKYHIPLFKEFLA